MTNIPEFKDREITCTECGRSFTFEAGEQQYFWIKGLSEPKRCKPCRILRRRNTVLVQEVENG